MDFSFLNGRVNDDAFSDKPFTILNRDVSDSFSVLMEILLLETSQRSALEAWQGNQLKNLIKHASNRSQFLRDRLSGHKASIEDLTSLPVQLRKDVDHQYSTEGALLGPADGAPVNTHSSSGSSGTPVKFFYTKANADFNLVRSLAQDIIENRDLRENKVRVKTVPAEKALKNGGFQESKTMIGGIGALTTLFQCGIAKVVYYWNEVDPILKELEKFPVHNLSCNPGFLDAVLETHGVEALERLGVKRWVQHGSHRVPEVSKILGEAGIKISANYSCEEMGPLAYECLHHKGYYHVAGSNVLIEADETRTQTISGKKLSPLLITHLHSYATPFIRYDIGDFGVVHHRCPCGHDGITVSDIIGRAKSVIFRPNGDPVYFFFRGEDIRSYVRCDEFQIHQKDLHSFVVQIGGRESVSEDERKALETFLRVKGGYDFNVEIKPVDKIDWGSNAKKLGFTSAVAPANF